MNSFMSINVVVKPSYCQYEYRNESQLYILYLSAMLYIHCLSIKEKDMTVTVAKWGNSLAVRIPASEAAKAALKEGDEVDLTAAEKGQLIIQKISKEVNFDHLYAQMTTDNTHSEIDWGVSVGRENIEW